MDPAPDLQEETVQQWINAIDSMVSAQLSEVMHHPDFQRLEGTWRGLRYLVQQTESGENLKIRVLNVSKQELLEDMTQAVEFDTSVLFWRLCVEQHCQLGGAPYALLVGDYEFGRSAEDMSL